MIAWTLLATATVLAGVGAAFALAGRRAHVRAARLEDALAYVVFWYSASAFLAITAFMDALAALGVTDVLVFGPLNHVSGIALIVGCAGLAVHAAFIVRGDHRLVAPLAAYYLAAYTVLLSFGFASGTPTVDVGAWSVEVSFGEGAPSWAMTATLAIVLTPPALAAGALLLVARRVREVAHRRRIALVAGPLLAWMVAAVVITPQATFWTGPLLYVAGATSLLAAVRRPAAGPASESPGVPAPD